MPQSEEHAKLETRLAPAWIEAVRVLEKAPFTGCRAGQGAYRAAPRRAPPFPFSSRLSRRLPPRKEDRAAPDPLDSAKTLTGTMKGTGHRRSRPPRSAATEQSLPFNAGFRERAERHDPARESPRGSRHAAGSAAWDDVRSGRILALPWPGPRQSSCFWAIRKSSPASSAEGATRRGSWPSRPAAPGCPGERAGRSSDD